MKKRWATTRVRYVCSEVDVRTGDESLPLLSVSIHRGVVPRSEISDRDTRADDTSAYKRCLAGDIVLNRMSAFEGAVGISTLAGLVTPEYMVLRAEPDCEPRYLHYLFKSSWFVGEMTSRLRGIGSPEQGNVRTPRIYWRDLSVIRVQFPCQEEQCVIADFLDRETARIDQLVAAKAELLQLLVERRRTVVDALFSTNGWPETKLKYLLAATPSYGVLVPSFVETGGIPLIRVGDLTALSERADRMPRIRVEQSLEYRRTVVREGDVLVSVVGSLDKVAVVDERTAGSNISRAIARLQARSNISRGLLKAWFSTTGYARQVAAIPRSPTAQPVINMSELSNFSLRYPGSPDARADAETALRAIEDSIANLGSALTRQLGLLAERRQALITAAVIGDESPS